MRVAIIGAGLAGLIAARDLALSGHTPVIFEKSRGVGGRIASRRAEGTVLDHGMPAVFSDGPVRRLALGLGEVPREVTLPTGAGDGRRTNDAPPLAWPDGLTRLPKQLAEGHEVRLSVRIARMACHSGGVELGDEQGNGHGHFERVIVTAPAPQAAELLAGCPGGGERSQLLERLSYAPALVLLAGLSLPAHPPWFGARDVVAGTLSWVGVESAKARPAPDGVVPVVAHLGADRSRELFEATDAEITATICSALAEVLGEAAMAPSWSQVKRWRYAVPRERCSFDRANPPGARVIVCGDSITATAGLDAVLESGRAAAAMAIA